MVEHSKVHVKLSDAQLQKLKTTVNNKAGTALRISFKMYNGKDLPHDGNKRKNKVKKRF